MDAATIAQVLQEAQVSPRNAHKAGVAFAAALQSAKSDATSTLAHDSTHLNAMQLGATIVSLLDHMLLAPTGAGRAVQCVIQAVSHAAACPAADTFLAQPLLRSMCARAASKERIV
ncbi:hypothetical protein EON67_10140, partial [archaeon]